MRNDANQHRNSRLSRVMGNTRVSTATAPSTRRRHERAPRVSVFKFAEAIFPSRQTIKCVIRNLSETGALIAADSVEGFPEYFTLNLPTGRGPTPVQLVWQKDNNGGVRFLDRAEAPPPAAKAAPAQGFGKRAAFGKRV